MSYNPAKDMPKTMTEWNQLVDFYLAKEDGKEQPLARADIEAQFSFYYPQEQPEIPAMPAPTFAEQKRMKLSELDGAFKTACGTAVAIVDGLTINADETANRNVQGLIIGLEAKGSEGPAGFCLADNSFAEVTLATLKAFQLAIIEKGQQLYARKWQLRSAIEAAEDEAALSAIVISFAG